jgi:hypothetical protein
VTGARRYLVAGDRDERVAAADLVRRAAAHGNAPPGAVLETDAADTVARIDALVRAGEAPSLFLVPTPHAPHYFATWLLAELPGGWRTVEPLTLPEVAFARRLGHDVLASVAEWRCPPRCIEPAICPATRQPKRWRIEEAIAAWAHAAAAACPPLVSRLAHQGGGVMALQILEWIAARASAIEFLEGQAADSAPLLAATLSACHARATLLGRDRADEAL